MASLVLPAASATNTNHRSNEPHCFHQSSNVISFAFPSNSKPKLQFSVKGVQSKRNHSTLVKAELNEVRFWHWFSFKDLVSVFGSAENSLLGSSIDFKVTGNGSSNIAAPVTSAPKVEKKLVEQANEPSPAELASESSVSEFMSQVSSLVKLVNSKDIVELQLKQSDCELVIRKKEALPQPPSPNNVVMMHSAPPAAFTPPTSAPKAAPVSSSTQSSSAAPPAGKSKSSLPPLKCPMAGTFYRCPAPGEPPFVKVGDKVQKGQIVCIIEAMKLMNEIEADRTGIIVEVLVEDGKPVSVDMPLFAIEP